MSNLLPENYKEELRKEYRLRFLSVGGMLLFVLFIVTSFVFGTYLFSLRSEAVILRAADAKGDREKDEKRYRDVVFVTNDKLTILENVENAFLPTELVELALRNTPDNVRLTRFQFAPEGEKVTITLSGVAPTREALVLFLEALEALPDVTLLKSPLSNLSKSTDIQFTTNFTLQKHGTR